MYKRQRLPADGKKQAEDKIADVRTAMEGDNMDAIRTATQALEQFVQTLGAGMYNAEPATDGVAGAGAANGANGAADKKGEDVVDAEFTEA